MRRHIFYTFIATFTLYDCVYNEEIEYYPSQSFLDNTKNEIVKREAIKHTHTNDKENNIEIEWRHFNEKTNESVIHKRAVDPVFHGYPKTREELWMEHFLNESTAFDQSASLIKLIHNITLTYLHDCTPVILYDSQVKAKESYFFQDMLKNFPVTFVHGYIDDNDDLAEPKLILPTQECLHFIVFLYDISSIAKVLGKQSESKIVLVARSSQWAVQEFLSGPMSRVFINLLVIGQSFNEDNDRYLEAPYILYTHKLYIDGLGASQPIVLNSWAHGKFSRELNLFPPKMTEGYAGHRFVVAAANQPPFVIRRIKTDSDGGNPRVTWDGIEVRLLRLLAERNNFSVEMIEPKELSLGPGDAVSNEIARGRADIGVAGIYVSADRVQEIDLTFAHSHDCAVFITLTSTALPRYRAILGPFHWHVWVALTLTYMFGIFPLAFSDKHTLRHLLHNSGEVENMFWYVFGTFTNCFTFLGKNSWSKTDKITTRLLIGWYWLFTIIITSCYTGSIIAFVTLPVFPETVDSVLQLLKGFYRIGTLDRGGWERWFFNSSDSLTNKLLKKMEFVPSIEAGIRNTTKAFFWPYAFLGSKAELKYITQANYSSTKSKRAVLHISNECFVPFGVIMGFPNQSLHTAKLSGDIRRVLQSGIMDKIVDEVRWDIQKSRTGGFLSVAPKPLKITSVEEKGLTLEDTQGMFLLLAAGFLLAATALISEWMGGFGKKCRPNCRNKANIDDTSNTAITLDGDNEMSITRADGNLEFNTRSTSANSRDTLDGQIINVTADSITIHNTLDTNDWDSRRSSSVDLDKEVMEIFVKDQMRRGVSDMVVVSEDTEDGTVSEAFGGKLKLERADE